MTETLTSDTPPSEFAFEFDKRAREALLPYRETAAVKALDWVSKAGDQLQMRVIAGSIVLLGLARRSPRMVGAGVRMLAAHELATFTKDKVKDRVVRSRPRSASGEDKRPRKGQDSRKEKSSFPSGHAAGATAAAQAFGAVYPRHAAAARAAAGVVMIGRVPSCAHYPSDVAAGAAIGAGSAGVVTGVWRLLRLVLRRAIEARAGRT